MRFAGVDGTRRGWVAVICEGTLRKAAAVFVQRIALLPRDLRVVAVDIPIGLPARGGREADTLARRQLGPARGRSVFPCPIRPALAAADWWEACRRTERADGRRVTRQTFGILPRVREVDELLRTQTWARQLIREVHPELSFALWGGGAMRHVKRSAAGRRARQRLIAETFGRRAFLEARKSTRGNGVAEDDLADAFAAAWTASRLVRGTARPFPAEVQVDEVGLAMQIWA